MRELKQSRLGIIVLSAILFASAVRAQDRRSGSFDFYGLKNKGSVQATLGTAEVIAGILLYRSALKGPQAPKITPLTGHAANDAKIAMANAREHYNMLKQYQAGRGAGVIRSVKLLGASVLIIDAAGRAYEWLGTSAEPSWLPIAEGVFSKDSKDLVKDIPEVSPDEIPATPAPVKGIGRAPKPKFDEKDIALEKELKEKLQGNLTKFNPNYKREIEETLRALEAKRIAAEAAGPEESPVSGEKTADGKKEPTHSASSSRRGRPSDDFFGTGVSNKNVAQAVLFGGDLLGSYLLIRKLMTPAGLKAIQSAEQALEKVKALEVTKNDKLATPESQAKYSEALQARVKANREALAILEEAGPVATIDAATKRVKDLEAKIETLRGNSTLTPNVKSDLIKAAEAELAEARLALTRAQGVKQLTDSIRKSEATMAAIREGRYVGQNVKADLVKAAEADLAEARALAARTARTGKLIKTVRVVGSTVLIADAIGRVYQWNQTDADPKFSPAMSWVASHGAWRDLGDSAVATKDFFVDYFDSKK